MENLDIIIFTLIIIVLFTIFGIGTFLEFKKMSNENTPEGGKRGGAASFLDFLGKIFRE
jgi:hypothetical protein